LSLSFAKRQSLIENASILSDNMVGKIFTMLLFLASMEFSGYEQA
jgi:hypothetical protein